VTHRDDAAAAVAAAVAAERDAVVAGLIRVTGDWSLAEDCTQDAVERALVRWPVDGIPQAPGAWLTTVARRRALDLLRRRHTERAKLQQRALHDESAGGDDGPDRRARDRLSLLFTCCHPALPLEGRVALTLKVVAGLTTEEIARAFLVPEATMAQRLLRTKRKIAAAAIPYRVPPPELLAERTAGVLTVLYLVFNEGYGRPDDRLVVEARRLTAVLADLMPGEDEVHALGALLAFQASRRRARFDADGDLVPIDEQDRRRWDRDLIAEGARHLQRSARSGRPAGPLRLQAEIAARHAGAAAPDLTPWDEIVPLYDALLAAQPSPVVALNRAIAVGFRDGFAAGLAALDAVDDDQLRRYHLLPAARADFLRRLGRSSEARAAYLTALDLVPPGGPEHRLLRRGLAQVGPEVGHG
jgi:RNA polymerase sigma-70 factor, ECF subfamily